MKRLFVIGGLLAGFALVAGDARAQTGTARGRVVDDKGQPVVEAKLTLDYQGGVKRTYEVKTNKKGEYTQVGLSSGVYRITATKDGYAGSFIETRVSLGEPTMVPDLKLMSAQVAQQAAAAKVVDEMGPAFNAANELAQAGKLDEAEAAYKALLVKFPTKPEIHYNLGYVYSHKKDFAAAEAAYQKAIELKPNYTQAYTALSNLYLANNQAAKASEIMAKAPASGGEQGGRAQFQMGYLAFNAGKYDEAAAAFQKAAEQDPSNAEVHYYLGSIAVSQDKRDECVAHFEKYLASSPKDTQMVTVATALLQACKTKR